MKVKLLTHQKLDPITALVMEYKRTGESKTFKKIYDLTRNYPWKVMSKYNLIATFPVFIQEEIVEGCRGEILLRHVRNFDITKKAKFTTHYTWGCMSYIRVQRNCYLRRKDMLGNLSLSDLNFERNEGGCCVSEKVLSTFQNENSYFRTKRKLKDFFNGSSYFLKLFPETFGKDKEKPLEETELTPIQKRAYSRLTGEWKSCLELGEYADVLNNLVNLGWGDIRCIEDLKIEYRKLMEEKV